MPVTSSLAHSLLPDGAGDGCVVCAGTGWWFEVLCWVGDWVGC